jgi:DNA helicase II / ATP-dependent DNA helicase PcrA
VLARRVIDALAITEPGPFARWRDASIALPQRCAAAVTDTVSVLESAAGLEATSDRVAAILSALRRPLEARYPDAAVRLADLERLADAAAASPSLHEALVQLALDPPVSASDLAGRPRLDEDFLIISTMHSAKGLEWPVVHLPQLADGAVPSDMALTSRAGLAEEQRLFYVAVTRARDRLYLYAPLRMHHHRTPSSDRHSYAQLTRFLTAAALAHCEITGAEPARPLLAPLAPLAAAVDAQLSSLWTTGIGSPG